ncbi:PDZ domain-containing protein [Nevskia sp.]|uniref:M61 family metallopeptidase n=1 Tax=Nevskia sp. TaxID=1929292 RepID=UPI0025DA321D|nr:PDZ domain-containing protein [Nevskia sp.]
MTAVRYRVRCDALAHRFAITGSFDSPLAAPVLRLPNWLRGSYLVRDFAKHVQGLKAFVDDLPVAITRLDKASFRVEGQGRIRLEYSVHALDSSVRKAYLDTRRGFFNGSSLFYCPAGFEQSRYEISIERPDAALCPGWKLATSLRPVDIAADGFGVYLAGGYEELIDCPVEMAAYQSIDFDVDGIAHSLILSGRCEPDLPRLASDIAKICEVQRALFGHEPPMEKYLFLTQVTGNGYGGLEHRTSTALVTARDALPRLGQTGLRKGYRGFLGLVSHEYFHLWNVKRITAARFADNDLSAEAYSEDLWAYEGVTSYYDDLMLLRAGLIDAPNYLDLLAEAATRLQRTPGRAVQTLADASFEAWIKYYQPDENTPNAAVNYYVKGALATVCLDLWLRLRSQVTLDDVMRALWTRYGAQDLGVPEGGLEAIASEISGLDLKPQFDLWLRGTSELPLTELLAEFGVTASLRASHGASDEGGRSEARHSPATELGLSLRSGDVTVATVFSGSAAERAGLAGGDQLVAIDGLKVTAGNWANRLEALHPGVAVALAFFRGDELMTAMIEPAAPGFDTWTFALAEASGAVLERRLAWLGC